MRGRALRIGIVAHAPEAQEALLRGIRQVRTARAAAMVTDAEGYEALLAAAGERVDAVYLALPGELQSEHAIRAARCGLHVLCERPMAASETAGTAMVAACQEAGVQLMVGSHLHFEAANLFAMAVVQRGWRGRCSRRSRAR